MSLTQSYSVSGYFDLLASIFVTGSIQISEAAMLR
jgi:hypothetical protein